MQDYVFMFYIFRSKTPTPSLVSDLLLKLFFLICVCIILRYNLRDCLRNLSFSLLHYLNTFLFAHY